MPDAPALALVGITHRFGAAVAVSDVTLSVASGERRILMGTNGAGKTTLINIILGDLLPDAGTVSLFGRNVTRMPAHRRIRLGMRRTYQTSATFSGLSVRDCLFLAVSGVGTGRFDVVRSEGAGRAMEAAEEAAARAGVPFRGLWLQAPIALLEQRVADRTGDASDATVAVLRSAARGDPGAGAWVPIDATDAIVALDQARNSITVSDELC